MNTKKCTTCMKKVDIEMFEKFLIIYFKNWKMCILKKINVYIKYTTHIKMQI